MKNLFFLPCFLTFLFFLFSNRNIISAQILPLDQLVLKGTHNSYASESGDCFPFAGCDNTCPVMHNQPFEQMRDWNAWFIELDVSIIVDNSDNPVLLVGHDYAGHLTLPITFGLTLKDYLEKIRDKSVVFDYRPTIIYFNRKGGMDDYKWGDAQYKSAEDYGPVLDNLLVQVFGSDHIFGPKKLSTNGLNWPTVPALAGSIIPYTDDYQSEHVFGAKQTLFFYSNPCSGCQFHYFETEIFPRWYSDGSTDLTTTINKIAAGNKIIARDDYQQDWTFNLLAPSNPVFVNNTIGQEPYFVTNELGGEWCDHFNDKGKTFTVNQHGTYRFPFDEIGESVNTAFPGWTLLIHTGNYPENLTINKPLVLKAEGGPVRIGN